MHRLLNITKDKLTETEVHKMMRKKYIYYSSEKIYAIYYQSINTMYYNLNFDASNVAIIIKK